MAKRKRTNNDLQNTTQKTKDRAIRIQLNTHGNSGSPEGWAVPGPLVALVMSLINKEGPGSVYDKWNISLVFCNSDIP